MPVLLVLGGLLTACDSTTPAPPDQFPNLLQRGERWTYDVRFTERPVDSATVDTVFTTRARMQVDDTGVNLGGRSGLVEVTLFPLSQPDSMDRVWYQQSPDSLVEVAYTSPPRVGGTLPLSREQSSIQTHRVPQGLTRRPLLVRRHHSANRLAAARDTVTRRDSRVVLQTPLDPGATWTSFRDPFLSIRRVDADTTLTTPAGRFETTKIATTLPDLAPELRWTDYVGTAGLVRRVVTDTVERRSETGTAARRVVLREVYTLTDHRD